MSGLTIAGVIFATISVISFVLAALFYFSGVPSLFTFPIIAGVVLLAIGLYLIYMDRLRDESYDGISESGAEI